MVEDKIASIKLMDVKDKIVIIRFLTNTAEEFDNAVKSVEPLVVRVWESGCKSIIYLNHLAHVDTFTDEEPKKIGLKRIED